MLLAKLPRTVQRSLGDFFCNSNLVLCLFWVNCWGNIAYECGFLSNFWTTSCIECLKLLVKTLVLKTKNNWQLVHFLGRCTQPTTQAWRLAPVSSSTCHHERLRAKSLISWWSNSTWRWFWRERTAQSTQPTSWPTSVWSRWSALENAVCVTTSSRCSCRTRGRRGGCLCVRNTMSSLLSSTALDIQRSCRQHIIISFTSNLHNSNEQQKYNLFHQVK